MTCVLSAKNTTLGQRMPKLGHSCTEVKVFLEQFGEKSVAAIKERLRIGLEGRRLTWLAEATGDDYKNVHRWVSGPTEPPPDFIARYCAAVGVSADWVLLERGTMRAVDPLIAVSVLLQIQDLLEATGFGALRNRQAQATAPEPATPQEQALDILAEDTREESRPESEPKPADPSDRKSVV